MNRYFDLQENVMKIGYFSDLFVMIRLDFLLLKYLEHDTIE